MIVKWFCFLFFSKTHIRHISRQIEEGGIKDADILAEEMATGSMILLDSS